MASQHTSQENNRRLPGLHYSRWNTQCGGSLRLFIGPAFRGNREDSPALSL
jgi:hypothetical protein